MKRINHRKLILSNLVLAIAASFVAVLTRCEPLAAGCEGALCSLECDEDDVSASVCPRPLACVGDRCELQVEACSKDEPVDACICSPPWVVRGGRCVDLFVERVCAGPGSMRSAMQFAETCDASAKRCSQLLKLDGARLRSILESAPVRSTLPWDGTLSGLPRVDGWLAEHEESSLYGGEPFVIAVAVPPRLTRRSRARRVSPLAVSEAMQSLVGGTIHGRIVSIVVSSHDGLQTQTLDLPPGSVALVGYPCVVKDEEG